MVTLLPPFRSKTVSNDNRILTGGPVDIKDTFREMLKAGHAQFAAKTQVGFAVHVS